MSHESSGLRPAGSLAGKLLRLNELQADLGEPAAGAPRTGRRGKDGEGLSRGEAPDHSGVRAAGAPGGWLPGSVRATLPSAGATRRSAASALGAGCPSGSTDNSRSCKGRPLPAEAREPPRRRRRSAPADLDASNGHRGQPLRSARPGRSASGARMRQQLESSSGAEVVKQRGHLL